MSDFDLKDDRHCLGILISGAVAGSMRHATMRDNVVSKSSFDYSSKSTQFLNARMQVTVNFCKISTS